MPLDADLHRCFTGCRYSRHPYEISDPYVTKRHKFSLGYNVQRRDVDRYALTVFPVNIASVLQRSLSLGCANDRNTVICGSG